MVLKKSVLILFVLFAGFAMNACQHKEQGVEAAKESTAVLLPAEQDFLMKVSQSNQAEVQLARLAQERTMNSDVKDYAEMLISDHQKALERVWDLAKKYDINPPTQLTPETQQEMDTMSKLSGPELDREFANAMVQNHQKGSEMFREQLSFARNPDIKDYVDDMLPKLQHHLEEAQKLQSKLFRGQ